MSKLFKALNRLANIPLSIKGKLHNGYYITLIMKFNIWKVVRTTKIAEEVVCNINAKYHGVYTRNGYRYKLIVYYNDNSDTVNFVCIKQFVGVSRCTWLPEINRLHVSSNWALIPSKSLAAKLLTFAVTKWIDKTASLKGHA